MNPLSSKELSGSWATLIIPYDAQGHIDFKRLSHQIDVLIASKSNGIYTNGSTGEFLAQSEEEFLKISSLVAEKCESANMPFQIGVSHVSPQLSRCRLISIRD